MRKQFLQRMPRASLAPMWVCLGGCGAGMAAMTHGYMGPMGGGGAQRKEPGVEALACGSRFDT